MVHGPLGIPKAFSGGFIWRRLVTVGGNWGNFLSSLLALALTVPHSRVEGPSGRSCRSLGTQVSTVAPGCSLHCCVPADPSASVRLIMSNLSLPLGAHPFSVRKGVRYHHSCGKMVVYRNTLAAGVVVSWASHISHGHYFYLKEQMT